METTKLVNVQIVRERVLSGVMEIANGLMDNADQVWVVEDTKLVHVQIVHRERVLHGVMEIADGLMANVNQKVCNHQHQI